MPLPSPNRHDVGRVGDPTQQSSGSRTEQRMEWRLLSHPAPRACICTRPKQPPGARVCGLGRRWVLSFGGKRMIVLKRVSASARPAGGCLQSCGAEQEYHGWLLLVLGMMAGACREGGPSAWACCIEGGPGSERPVHTLGLSQLAPAMLVPSRAIAPAAAGRGRVALAPLCAISRQKKEAVVTTLKEKLDSSVVVFGMRFKGLNVRMRLARRARRRAG
jgi:hypothetical protein